MIKPDCYKCIHRGTIPGDAHSMCRHPLLKGTTNDPTAAFAGFLASRGVPARDAETIIGAATTLAIRGTHHGIMRGWFHWPWNFDPVWLESCSGFEPKERGPLREEE